MGLTTVIHAGRVLTPLESYAPGTVVVEGEVIKAVGPRSEIPVPPGAVVVDVPDKMVIPGLIDTHVHGRDGQYWGDTVESTAQLCRSIAATGVTGVMPTLETRPDLEEILERIRIVRQAMVQTNGGAEIIGIQMEGPFLSGAETARGSQDVTCLRKPSVEELHRMVEASENSIRKMAIAPELDGALDVIRELARLGIVASAAHSAATYEQAMEAVEAGLNCATHAFNGMIPLHHRRPGLLGAVLTCDEINGELIGDGQHVGAVAMEILLRCKGTDRVHLISDNTIWAGLPNGRYEWSGGRTIVKEDNRVYVEGGTLAGSVAPLNFDVLNVARSTGCTLQEAVKMATWNPAVLVGVADRKGSLEPGKDADLVIVDDEMSVYRTMVKGRQVFVHG